MSDFVSETKFPFPECWGHRGASAAFPENTLASFEQAIEDGAEGIETDLHLSADGVILMFHDPDLARTTFSTGKIKERNWYGPDGMQHLRTRKEPSQPIPTFGETMNFLMRPKCRHVSINLDVKPDNDATRIFTLMREIITAQPKWQTELAPRIILGLWHPKFIPLAKTILPFCRRSHIGASITIARTYFWDECESFSILMPIMATYAGQKFLQECKDAGKKTMVWTVNTPDEMVEASRWGVDVILTDFTLTWLKLREQLTENPDMMAQFGVSFYWRRWVYWWPIAWIFHYLIAYGLSRRN